MNEKSCSMDIAIFDEYEKEIREQNSKMTYTLKQN